jgi:hypothetical protein
VHRQSATSQEKRHGKDLRNESVAKGRRNCKEPAGAHNDWFVFIIHSVPIIILKMNDENM